MRLPEFIHYCVYLKAFEHSYGIHGSTVGWYLKADDDVYVVMENLQYILSNLDPDKPYYLGKMMYMRPELATHGYHSGGAG